jgi:hypothetical protein
MKKFNLNIALDQPDRVTFRDRGGLVSVADFVHLEYANKNEQPIVVVDSKGRVTRHCADGSYLEGDEESGLDLMLRIETHSRWANVYKDKYGQVKIGGVHLTRHDAEGVAYAGDDYIDTILIEWEE